jgi:hypothetical protein
MSAGGISDVLREMAEGQQPAPRAERDRESSSPPRPAKAVPQAKPVRPPGQSQAGAERTPAARHAAGQPVPARGSSAAAVAARPATSARKPATGLKRHASVVLLAGAVVTLLPAIWALLFYAGVPVFERARQEPESASRMALAMLLACVPVALLLLAGAVWYHLQHAAAKRHR